MEVNKQECISVFVVVSCIVCPRDGAVYEIKLRKESEEAACALNSEVFPFFTEVDDPVLEFFDKSFALPKNCYFGAARHSSKLYLTAQGGFPEDASPPIPESFVFDTANLNPIETISQPRAAKTGGAFFSAYGKLYYCARFYRPYCRLCVPKELSFECYDPDDGSWKLLPPCPTMTELRGMVIYGFAVCYGYILFSLFSKWEKKYGAVAFRLKTGKWHLVQVCKSAQAKKYYPFRGRAVVLDDGLIYAANPWYPDQVKAFSFSRDSAGNCFLGTPMSLSVRVPCPPWPLEPFRSQRLIQLGRNHLCLIQTGRNFDSIKHQYLCATTFQIDHPGEAIVATTLSSYVFQINTLDHFDIEFCFTRDYEDNEPEEKDCPTAPAETESSSALGEA